MNINLVVDWCWILFFMERKRTVQVLFLGSIERTEEANSQDKPAD